LFVIAAFAQDTVVANGHNVFHYPNGKVSSEGFMKDGQPDGYWKTYYENGVLKSEGNRKEFLLDSTWKFYSDSGNLLLVINYSKGKKNGNRITYQKGNILEENFIDDVKQGWTKVYYNDGSLKRKVFFVDGREEGIAREYSPDGTVITLIEYKKGYILNTENINRSREGLKHGVWKQFYPNEAVKEEGYYNYGKKDGYFKEFDTTGNLLSIKKYANDLEIFDAPELASYEIRTDYYKNGKPKIVASYKDGIPEGVRREYDPEGEIVRSYIFKGGIIVGEGIIDASGSRQGPWKEYYETTELYGEGNYKDNKRVGPWKFYFKDGKIEQSGSYNAAGNPDGPWKWFYESGNLKREETLKNGKSNGEMKELTDSGQVIIKGEFVDGEEEGEWFYEVNDDRVIGSYVNGKREGLWKSYDNGTLYYEGNFIEGLADGTHIWYWDNGKIREKGTYIAGKKEGTWVLYGYDGVKLLTQEYVDGIEVSIDGSKIDQEPGK
jgi:antitoxin component YwqK of YwqJK toxin-antitoxin module